ncbi:MAG: UDP-N-acetylmuramate--L-alanine ligase [Treponema sp.]|nr:UDP-N-acetylmuramate--L-alanine ligase [Treponema sp.]
MDIRQGFVSGSRVYFIGIKGTGMAALAEFLHNRGVLVSGSDSPEVFYTDTILKELGIPYYEGFDAKHIGKGKNTPDLVVYSDAYSFTRNQEMAEAQRQEIPVCQYSEALGAYSELADSSGIAGVHGKTTLTAMTGTLMRAVNLPAQVLVGGAVSGFGYRSTLDNGDKYFIAETDEYRRHFLFFSPNRIVLTAIEPDHQDYYPDYNSIREGFLEYLWKLPPGGELIYCTDDPGAAEAAGIISWEKRNIKLIPYGFTAEGDWGIISRSCGLGYQRFKLRGLNEEFELRYPGKHSCLNAAAAIALTSSLIHKEYGGWNREKENQVKEALKGFTGARRRSEIIGEAGGILFMDDYGHTPAEVKTTTEGLKEFYGRRLILSFMSHTYTRTSALLNEFAASFESADLLVLHRIYGSAREVYTGQVTGMTLFEKTKALMGDRVFYCEEPENAADMLKEILRPGDLFITMGAGDNWRLGRKLFEKYSKEGSR